MTGLIASREAIRAYATLTDDWNPIHLDPEFAATTAMGRIIAHGTMSLNLVWLALEERFGPSGLRGLTLDVRFVAPVREDDRVQVVIEDAAAGPIAVAVRREDGTDVIVGIAQRQA
ncbi:MAG: MaoC/PaaZ C-terminal domain-containing protein [Sphingomonas sp.]